MALLSSDWLLSITWLGCSNEAEEGGVESRGKMGRGAVESGSLRQDSAAEWAAASDVIVACEW